MISQYSKFQEARLKCGRFQIFSSARGYVDGTEKIVHLISHNMRFMSFLEKW
jgi:hypothetical protein